MSDNKMYNILNTLKGLEPTPEQTAKATAQSIYESVAAQGSVMQGVNSVEARLNEKYMGFKQNVAEGIEEAADPVRAKLAKAIGKYFDKIYSYDDSGLDIMDSMCPTFNRLLPKYGNDLDKMGQKAPVDVLKRLAQELKACAEECDLSLEEGMGEGIAEEREKLQTKKGTIYKGGTYGTEYDPSDEEKKTKAKHVPKTGQKGRPKKDKPAASTAPKGDIFGRTTGEVPKGKKGTKIKGKGNIDTVDEGSPLRVMYKSPADWEGMGSGRTRFVSKPEAEKRGSTITAKMQAHRDATAKAVKDLRAQGKDPRDPTKDLLTYRTPVPAIAEGADYKKQNFIVESFNFAEMMKETDQTVQEMLTELQNDIQAFKTTGECTPKLDAFLRVHGHTSNKKKLSDAAPVPYEVPAVQRKAAGAPALTPTDVQQQDANRSMHPGMTKLDAPAPAESMNQELDELARLAGITDEGNAFTGKLANTPKGGEFGLGGKTFKDTSDLDEGGYDPEQPNGGGAGAGDIANESTCMECGMYESKCTCQEGNLFTKHLKDTPKGGEFEIDGKKFKDTSNLDEGTCPECHADPCECPTESTTLEDIARLAGIAVEGKDYGDTAIAKPPTYDNTPDEEVQGEDVLTKGGDGEVAGKEKAMHGDKPTWKNGDNPIAESEFNPVEAMGRKLMKQYEAIKVAK